MKNHSVKPHFSTALFVNTALVLASVVFAVSAAVCGFSSSVLNRLMQRDLYREIVLDLELGKSVSERIVDLDAILPQTVSSFIKNNDSVRKAMSDLDVALENAVDDAAIQVADQIPAFIDGGVEHLACSLSLKDYKKMVLDKALKSIPLAGMFEATIRKAIESNLPDNVAIDYPLKSLELILNPLKIVVSKLRDYRTFSRNVCILAGCWILFLGFEMAKSARWAGSVLIIVGFMGWSLNAFVCSILDGLLPVQVTTNLSFQSLVVTASDGLQLVSQMMLSIGFAVFLLSFAIPLVFKLVGKSRTGCGILTRKIIISKKRRRYRWTLATLLALLVAPLGYFFDNTTPSKRTARAFVGGAVFAASILDCALPVLVMSSVDIVCQRVSFRIALLVSVYTLLVVFWLFRDGTDKNRGFNFIDGISGLRRVKDPGKKGRALFALRSLPLVVGVLVSSFSPFIPTFGAVAAITCASLFFLWPNRTLFDVIAGTRAELLR